MTLADLNQLAPAALQAELGKCCGASTWIAQMAAIFPVQSVAQLLAAAETTWFRCQEQDWREAFQHHPRIGDLNSLQEKFAASHQWAAGEQAGIHHASAEVLQALARGNQEYEAKFGYLFLVCATGKSAEEMLALLQARLPNPPEAEIKIAMAEQNKITKIRLAKLLSP
jgi:2-oxo-4-hydroxy-4-carboxy-5-ureidoimidazoline decarboxylase